METLTAKVGNVLIGSGNRIVLQTMCNTHTSDVDGTVAQCVRMHEAGAGLIRITCPGMGDVKYMKEIREKLRAMGIDTPLVADIHFSSISFHFERPSISNCSTLPMFFFFLKPSSL